MEILFNWIGGATFILSIGNLKIAVDPVLCEKGTVQDFFWFKSKRIESPVYSDSDFEKIDLWLITHRHEDHLDKTGLSKISDSSIIICNKDSYNVLKQNGADDITVLRWKQVTKIYLREYQIEIEAIPAIHGVNPLSAWLVHYAAFEHYKEPVEKIRNLNDQRIKIIETGVETVLYSS
ncbi:MAG: MBL fold metallo-hydrolase [Bacteroidales bacterium]|nr:MBL fold metallo-hydrolase [Bacteroidales bacterium]